MENFLGVMAKQRRAHPKTQATHVALQFVGFFGLNHVVLVRQARPLV